MKRETDAERAQRWFVEADRLRFEVERLEEKLVAAERRYEEAEDTVRALTLALREVTALRRGGVR